MKKKDGGIWFCVDYRQLNRVTIQVWCVSTSPHRWYIGFIVRSWILHYPWPCIWVLASVHGSSLTGKDTLCDLFRAVWVQEDASWFGECSCNISKIGWSCFEWNGQRCVYGVPGWCVSNCHNLQEHNDNLIKVFQQLRSVNLTLKPKKCKFAQLEVCYLGHVVSAVRVCTDPAKLQTVLEFPVNTNVK